MGRTRIASAVILAGAAVVVMTAPRVLADHSIFCIDRTTAHKYTGDNGIVGYNDIIAVTAQDAGSPWGMAGKQGYDTITGGDAGDAICGNEDPDALNGAAGSDKLNGGFGTDSVQGSSGQDEIHGGEDADPALQGGTNNDSVFGDNGADTLYDSGGSADTGNGGPGTNDSCQLTYESRSGCESTFS
jgi:Ca2+-binding RTX toxin-like protein